MIKTLKLGNKRIQYRTWQVKDKKKFISGDVRALVYDCLTDKNIILSNEEYKYVLLNIRNDSISTPISYIFNCDSCNKDFDYTANIAEIFKPMFSEFVPIVCGDYTFKMGRIKNKEFYYSKTGEINDFILHIQSINGVETHTFEEIVEIINNLDVDVFEEIFKSWLVMKFKVKSTHSVECPNCHFVSNFDFDDLPSFFPPSWNV